MPATATSLLQDGIHIRYEKVADSGILTLTVGTKNMVRALLGSIWFTVAASGSAQQPPADLSLQVADTSVFAPLTMPTPNAYRTGEGEPGYRYWQNRADYDINVVLDTTTHTLAGHLSLHYANNSPDTLDFSGSRLRRTPSGTIPSIS